MSKQSSPNKHTKSKSTKIKEQYYDYLQKSGLSMGFQIIFSQIVSKKISEDQVFEYTARRLRDFKNLIDMKKYEQQIAEIK